MTPLLPPCSDGWRRVTTKQKVKTTCQVGKTTYKIDIKLFLTRYRSIVQQIGKMHRSIYFNFYFQVKARLPQNNPSLCQLVVKLLLDLIQLKVRGHC